MNMGVNGSNLVLSCSNHKLDVNLFKPKLTIPSFLVELD